MRGIRIRLSRGGRIGLRFFCCAWLALLGLWQCPVRGQYFGRNKPVYHHIDFRVARSPHLDLYHYFRADSVPVRLACLAEAWYWRHASLFRDTIRGHNPILLYLNAGDFQQTNAVMSPLGVGTGGVTEGMRNRVILPMSPAWQETRHVLGHELVHAFQYNLARSRDSLRMGNLVNVPLWLVEGMAEYFSIGSVDPHTGIWMRDAVRYGYFPTLHQMTKDMARFFPYRYGQAICAYVGQRYGDSQLVPWFCNVALHGVNEGTIATFGIDADSLSQQWEEASYDWYEAQIVAARDSVPPGTRLLFEGNAGRMNICPSISPDGKLVAFYSERSRVEVELLLADVANGRVLRTLHSTVHGSEVDALHFVESGGAWSSDSRLFAYVGFRQGRNVLLVHDAARNRTLCTREIAGVPSFRDPAFSPDGRRVVVSGLVQGISNLYELDLETGRVSALTRDGDAQLQPTYSPDGRYVLFASDAQARASGRAFGYNLGRVALRSGRVEQFEMFPGARSLNPRYAQDPRWVYFLSDADGFRNLYMLDTDTRRLYRLTSLATGITGLTAQSPAMSTARGEGTVVYSVYRQGVYEVYRAREEDFQAVEVCADSVDFRAGHLAPGQYVDTVEQLVGRALEVDTVRAGEVREVPFRARFGLGYVANAGVGMSSGAFGTGMAGGVELIFTDITGNHMLYSGLSINGEVWDFGGQVSYINKAWPVQWAVGLSHVPYSTGYMRRGHGEIREVSGEEARFDTVRMFHLRDFESRASGMVNYPLSQHLRVEGGLSWSWHSFRLEEYMSLYRDEKLIRFDREKRSAPSPFPLWRAYSALVYDNSVWGFSSPWRGLRARVELEQVWGGVAYTGTVVDLRRYWFRWPVGFALRGYLNARWGIRERNRYMYPLFLGYPWLVRGYGWDVLFAHYAPGDYPLTINQLMGSHMVVCNAEFRLPLMGPRRVGLLSVRYVPVELAVFSDAGLVWYRWEDVAWRWQPRNGVERTPLVSVGVGLRFNVLGMMVVEPYYAMPLQLGGGRSAYFGLNLRPGW